MAAGQSRVVRIGIKSIFRVNGTGRKISLLLLPTLFWRLGLLDSAGLCSVRRLERAAPATGTAIPRVIGMLRIKTRLPCAWPRGVLPFLPRCNILSRGPAAASGRNSEVECLLPKQDVVGSNPIARSNFPSCLLAFLPFFVLTLLPPQGYRIWNPEPPSFLISQG